MSTTESAARPVQDDDLPRDEHLQACQIWTTNDKPCNCAELTTGLDPEPATTTSERQQQNEEAS